MNMYGSTLRVWDPSIQAWRITWRNPAGGHHEDQIGNWSGQDVVQIGTRPDGTQTRWTFTEIMPNSFRWLGEALPQMERRGILKANFGPSECDSLAHTDRQSIAG